MELLKKRILRLQVVFIWLFISLALDQLTKLIVLLREWPVLFNQGIAFGILPSQWWGGVVALIIVILLGYVFRLAGRLTTSSQIAFGLILGGGISNLLDRLEDGLVEDIIFIDPLPAFNLADLAVTLGVMLLLIRREDLDEQTE